MQDVAYTVILYDLVRPSTLPDYWYARLRFNKEVMV